MNEQTRFSQQDDTVPFTAEDFLHMLELGAFEDMRAELAGGVIEKMMPADWSHGEVNARLIGLLFPLVRAAGARAGVDVVIRIDDMTVRAFDIAVVRPGVAPVKALTGDQVLLAVEVADTTHGRDLGAKRVEYGAAGIPIYWVVDLVKNVTHVFRLDSAQQAYREPEKIPFDQPLDVAGLGGSITID